MLTPRLHPAGRNGPDLLFDVDFIPRRAEQLTRTRRRQDYELQGARSTGGTPSQVRHEERDSIVSERSLMPPRHPPPYRQSPVGSPAQHPRVSPQQMRLGLPPPTTTLV